MAVMTDDRSAVGFELDAEDQISILQLLTLSPSDRLQYLLDEIEFDEATGARTPNG